ncbi:MAG TPA: hypothetical protein VKV04_04440 [Verrucomicrobiae bacterium]|nr:hypothetical protein [Verrucomicrobiae bacterium]
MSSANSTLKITLDASTEKANAKLDDFFTRLNRNLNSGNSRSDKKLESGSSGSAKGSGKAEKQLGLIDSLEQAWNQFYNTVADTSRDLGKMLVSPFEGMREGIDKSMNELLLKGASAKQFFGGVAIGILSSMRKAFAGMVADFGTKLVMMTLQWAATQAGITSIFAAHTAQRTALHTAGEEAQTGATAVGAAARGALRLGETVFHGLMVAMRTGAHVLGEIAMTAATIANGLIRRAAAFLEAQPYIFLSAVKAASAVADIPYVGPILAPIAAATTFAALEAMAVFKQGGYTGDGSSDEVAGVVHRGEFVVPAERVNQVGLGFFEAIRSGRFSAASINALSAPHASDFQPGPGGSVIQHKTELSLATFGGEADAKRWAEGQDGETWFLNMMSKHAYRYTQTS